MSVSALHFENPRRLDCHKCKWRLPCFNFVSQRPLPVDAAAVMAPAPAAAATETAAPAYLQEPRFISGCIRPHQFQNQSIEFAECCSGCGSAVQHAGQRVEWVAVGSGCSGSSGRRHRGNPTCTETGVVQQQNSRKGWLFVNANYRTQTGGHWLQSWWLNLGPAKPRRPFDTRIIRPRIGSCPGTHECCDLV